MSECSITSQLQLVRADICAYRALQRHHYCDGALGPYCAIYALTRRTAQPAASENFVGVIVYAPSPLNCAVRDIAAGGFFARRPKTEKLALLNAHVRRISRVIIEPRYRGRGLAARLVRDTLQTHSVALIEVSITMGRLHPFFERAGMRAYTPAPDPLRQALRHTLLEAGIDTALWNDPPAAHRRLEALSDTARAPLEAAMRRFLNRFGRRRGMPPGLERTRFILNRLGNPPGYYAWLNPACPVTGLALV